jgi:hypothetical protein
LFLCQIVDNVITAATAAVLYDNNNITLNNFGNP